MVRRLTINGLVFEHIPLEDVRCAYERIEKDLHKVREKAYADWIPADIYAALKIGNADLFMGYDRDYYAGFIITSFIKDASGEPTLFLWATYQNPKYKHKDNGFVFLDKLAEDYKVTAVEFHSNRKGWERASKKHGYEIVANIYRKEM